MPEKVAGVKLKPNSSRLPNAAKARSAVINVECDSDGMDFQSKLHVVFLEII